MNMKHAIIQAILAFLLLPHSLSAFENTNSTIIINGKSATVETIIKDGHILLRSWTPEKESKSPIDYSQWSIFYDGQIILSSIVTSNVRQISHDYITASEEVNIYILEAFLPKISKDSYIILYFGLLRNSASIKYVYQISDAGVITILSPEETSEVYKAFISEK